MAAGQSGRHGAKLVHRVGTVLSQGTVSVLIHHHYMVVPTALGSHRKLRSAIHLPVQVIIMHIRTYSRRTSVLETDHYVHSQSILFSFSVESQLLVGRYGKRTCLQAGQWKQSL